MITIWLLVLVCIAPDCEQKRHDIIGLYTTLDECWEAAKREQRAAVCVQGIIQDRRKI